MLVPGCRWSGSDAAGAAGFGASGFCCADNAVDHTLAQTSAAAIIRIRRVMNATSTTGASTAHLPSDGCFGTVPPLPAIAPSSSTNVVATHSATMVRFGSTGCFALDRDLADVDDARELADPIEERAEVVVRPLRLQLDTESPHTSLLLDRPCGVKRWIARLDCVASPWMRRRMSATSFSSGSTCRRFSSRLSSSATCAWNSRQPPRGRDAPGDVGAQRGQPRLAHRRCRPASSDT